MFINLHRTVEKLGENLPRDGRITFGMLEKAYELTLRLRSHNHRLWDTSNRSINVIINNLKGIFFDDDDFAHMSFSVEAGWGEMGLTEVRICSHNELEKCGIFR